MSTKVDFSVQATIEADKEFGGISHSIGLRYRSDQGCTSTSTTDWHDVRLSQLPYYFFGKIFILLVI